MTALPIVITIGLAFLAAWLLELADKLGGQR